MRLFKLTKCIPAQAAELSPRFAGLGFSDWRPTGEPPMDEYTKTEVWDLAAGTFIAVSVFSGMAFIIVSAIH
jgi:hypothetical protein